MTANKPTLADLMPHDITPIENVPLRVQVANRLRKAILSGRMLPGAALVETALAEKMNVSRAPIREAIQILENDGLVETIAYKGKRVKPLTAREVAETYSLREVFEVMAVRLILESGAPLDTLRTHCDEMTAAAEANNFEALVVAAHCRSISRLPKASVCFYFHPLPLHHHNQAGHDRDCLFYS